MRWADLWQSDSAAAFWRWSFINLDVIGLTLYCLRCYGPVVALIGLELSGSAASNAGLLDEKISTSNIIVFGVTLGVAVFGSILFRNSFLLFRF